MDDAGHRLDAQGLQAPLIDDHHARRAVADLAGGGGGQHAVLVQQLHGGHAFAGAFEADAFVDQVHFLGPVGQRDLDGQDLRGEGAALGRGDGLLVARKAVVVELLAGHAVLLGDHLSALELAELNARIALGLAGAHRMAKARLVGQDDRGAHRHAAHALDAGGDDHVHLARHDGRGGEVDRLLRRAALAVDGGGGHAFRQLGGQHRAAGDVVGLLAGLTDAAHDDVLDQGGIGARAGDEPVQHFAGEVGRMPARHAAALAASGGAGGGDDIGFSHGQLSD